MILLSCVNCCHNPLQSDALGTSTGFCTEHRRVLLAPSQLTCGRHFRKDLPAPGAIRERELHRRRFTPAAIVSLHENKPVNGADTSASKADIAQVGSEPIGTAVLDYGTLDSKIASLAQLRFLPGVRSELALLSLGRAYVNRCVDRGGKWTSGVHILWWTRGRLATEPALEVTDLRAEIPIGLSRRVELAKWSLLMLRLIFVGDVASYAGRDRVSRLASIAERAAEDTESLSPKKLLQWIRRHGVRMVEDALPESRYLKLAAQLRKATEPQGP